MGAELADPLLDDDEPEHLAEQTGRLSVQDGPVRQVEEEPKLTQQNPVADELLVPLLEDDVLDPLLDDDEPEHLAEQTGRLSVQAGPCRQEVEDPTFTQQYPSDVELADPLRDDDEPEQRCVQTGSVS